MKKLSVFVIIVLLIAAVVAPSINSVNNQSKLKDISIGIDSFDPFKEGWIYRKMITINHTEVAGSLTNFPVLINTTDADLRDKAQLDGDDILFMDEKGKANRLYHEIECFDSSTGKLTAWVNITSLSSSIDTIFYIYYGNATCGNQQYPEKVWDSNYIAVYHMHDSSSVITDSTINNKDSITIYGNPTFQVSGIAGYSIYLDGIEDCFDMPAYGIWNGDFTIEAWSKLDFTDIDNHILLTMGGECKLKAIHNPYPTYEMWWSWYTDKWRSIPFTSSPDTKEWHYYVGAYDFDGNTEAFYDAESQGTDGNTGTLKSWPYTNRIGDACDAFIAGWAGKVDEIRYSRTVRSTEWIKTSYNTINDSSSFLIFATEETSLPPIKPIIDGPITGEPGISYSYTFNSTDPEDHDVYYYIKWGDGSIEDWFGPFPSGVEVPQSHTFENPGTYNIYAKAKDIYDLESEWAEFTVTMSRNKIVNRSLSQFLQSHLNLIPILQKLIQQLRFGL